VFVYLYKDLYFTTGLYAVYIGLAITGLISWHKSLQKQNKEELLMAVGKI
jgi:hypothetical protein